VAFFYASGMGGVLGVYAERSCQIPARDQSAFFVYVRFSFVQIQLSVNQLPEQIIPLSCSGKLA
jgi:hypothetical protein